MNIAKSKRPISIYFVIGIVGCAAVLIGFSKTFFVPLSQGQFSAPLTIHIHGAFAFGWIILYTIQALLIRNGRLQIHRSLGWIGALLALGVATTMIPAGVFQVKRDLAAGLGDTATSGILGVVTSAIMFTGLVGFGMLYRKKANIHKALMLLATIFVLWPAWFRFRHFFPSVPRPDIWFGLVLSEFFIVLAIFMDWRHRNKLNKTLLFVGAFIIMETSLEVYFFDSQPWRVASRWVYSAVAFL